MSEGEKLPDISAGMVSRAIAAFNSLPCEQQEEIRRQQRDSWVRGEMELSRLKKEAGGWSAALAAPHLRTDVAYLITELSAALKRAVEAEERCEAYKGRVEAGAKEIERLREALQEIRDMRTELPGRDGYERGFNDARFRCKNIADEALKAGSSADE